MSEEKFEATYQEIAQSSKALTEQYKCDYCGKKFQERIKAVAHIIQTHIRT